MKQIGVLSDTHGYMDAKILDHLKNCDQIWHAGDIGDIKVIDQLSSICEVKAVFGNIDGQKVRISFPEYNFFLVEGMKILILHIAGYPGRYNEHCRKLIHELNPDIVVAGHSHILKIIFDKKMKHLHINPGAAGKSGLHKIKTLVRFKIDNKNLREMEVVEMER